MIDLGSRLELFVDHFLIERLDGAALRLHHPQPRDVSIRFDRPWEGPYCAYVVVFQDGPLFRMYYRGLSEGKGPACTCCAASRDGIHWERPALGLHEFGGSKDNNIILVGQGTHNFAPFLDARPGIRPEHRYKALASGENPDTSGKGLLAFASADGIRWRLLQDDPVITKGGFDSLNVAFWSPAEGCYAAYYRVWSHSTDWLVFRGRRAIARATSPDFLHWSDPVLMTCGDTPPEELYTNATLPYFRAPHLYVAPAKRFVKGRRSPLEPAQIEQAGMDPKYAEDVSEGVLLTSRGGNRYDRTFMEAFFRPGPDRFNWVSRNNLASWGILQTGPAEMSLYYSQHYTQKDHHIVRAALRLDGFASVQAGYAGGQMLTKPLTFAGRSLVLNLATSAVGYVRVEIQDENGRAIPGFSLEECPDVYGDEIERPVCWRGGPDVSGLAGRCVRLRFALKDADLFALRFR